ncbi:MAG: MFS transporter [Ignavibacteriae bacterium]|nr:MFS transporter [Ignavibacteriota bacterium]
MGILKDASVEKKNFLLNLIEGSLYSSSGSLISPQTVLPALVAKLGGGNIEVGVVSVIAWVGVFLPQIFASRYVEAHAWKKPWAIKYGLMQRIFILLISLCLLFFGVRNPATALWLFLILYTLNQILIGVTTPGWFEMFAKMIPTKRRGRLFGIRSSIGGLGAFFFSIALTWFLAEYAFPLSFALAFGLAFLLQAASIIVQSSLIEEEPSPIVERKELFAYMRELPRVLRENIPFRNFLIATGIQILATMPMGFYTIYALSQFRADESVVGTFTLAIVAIQVGSSLGIGYLADRHGNKLTLIIAASALFCANLCALFSPSLEWFTLVYIFLGVNLGTELLARYNISIEYGPPQQRATYVGLMNTVLAPLYFVGMLGGVISNAFGYATVFAIGAIVSVVGIAFMLFKVEEPRRLHAAAHSIA